MSTRLVPPRGTAVGQRMVGRLVEAVGRAWGSLEVVGFRICLRWGEGRVSVLEAPGQDNSPMPISKVFSAPNFFSSCP